MILDIITTDLFFFPRVHRAGGGEERDGCVTHQVLKCLIDEFVISSGTGIGKLRPAGSYATR